jgi:hypothetical protein
MVIETFLRGAGPVYERAAEKGRMLPAGLSYVDSWVDEGLQRCFQLMETDDPGLFDKWIAQWSDLATFEIVLVLGSAEAAERRSPRPAELAQRFLVDARILGLDVLGRIGERLLAGLVVGFAAGALVGVTLLGVRPRLLARGLELLLGGLLLHRAQVKEGGRSPQRRPPGGT